MIKVQTVTFSGPAGHLEGTLKFEGAVFPRALSVVCHPHPLYHGTMHNKVVFAIAEAFFNLGCVALRFNFRGVGRSAGVHDRGKGEVEDCLAAVQFLRQLYPEFPCLIAGFSFGAWMAIEAARRDPTLISVTAAAPPLKNLQSAILTSLTTPKLILQGSADNMCQLEDFQAIYPLIAEPKSFVLFEGADHFFDGQLAQLKAAIVAHTSFLGLGLPT